MENKYYILRGTNDSTLYKIQKIDKYYYRLYQDIIGYETRSISCGLGTALHIKEPIYKFVNCGIGYNTKSEALIGLKLA